MNHLFIQNMDLYFEKEIQLNLKTFKKQRYFKVHFNLSLKNENGYTQKSIGISKVILMQVQSLHGSVIFSKCGL